MVGKGLVFKKGGFWRGEKARVRSEGELAGGNGQALTREGPSVAKAHHPFRVAAGDGGVARSSPVAYEQEQSHHTVRR